MKPFVLSTLLACAILPIRAQPPTGGGGQAPRWGGPGGGGGKRRGTPGPETVPLDDRTGFESIFDGSTLTGWNGDPDFWRAENGVIVGETSLEDYRMNSANSGVQYRSVALADVGKWVLKGYRADIDIQNTFSGQLYEERSRGFLALQGQMATIQEAQQKGKVLGAVHDGDESKGFFKINDWNTIHIIARGNLLTRIVNGRVMAVFVDDDAKNRMMDCLLGFQIDVGPPMKIESRNIGLKLLRQ